MGLGQWMPHVVRTGSGLAVVRTVRGADGTPVRVLQAGGVWQSATYLDARRMEPVFAYYRAFDHAFSVRPGTGHVLMIGGGGYAWPKHVLATRSSARLDVVEIDPAVTRAAQRWFFLDEAIGAHPGALRLVEDDGRAYLASHAEACRMNDAPRYDAIVNDAFSGLEPVHALATVEAARLARGCLVEGGLYLANVVSAEGGADVSFLRDVVATLGEAFAHVHVVVCADDAYAGEDNYLVIATDGPWQVPDAIPFDGDFPGAILRDA